MGGKVGNEWGEMGTIGMNGEGERGVAKGEGWGLSGCGFGGGAKVGGICIGGVAMGGNGGHWDEWGGRRAWLQGRGRGLVVGGSFYECE